MALDLAKLRAKLQESESGGKKSDNAFWRPTEGDQEIRIVPTEDGDPFKVYHFHYNLGDGVRGGAPLLGPHGRHTPLPRRGGTGPQPATGGVPGRHRVGVAHRANRAVSGA